MAAGDLYQLTVNGLLHGQSVLNVLHYGQTAGLAGDTSQQLVTAWRAANEALWLACHSNEYSIRGYRCQKVQPLPVLQAFELGLAGVVGTVIQNSLPTSVSVVLSKQTGFAGKSQRGRIYLAGVPVTFEEDSTLTGAAHNIYNNLGDSLIDDVALAPDTQWEFVLFRRSANIGQQVTAIVTRDELRNQRRRQVGRGI